jgi:hypothetical protein
VDNFAVKKITILFVRMAKRVRDAEGGVSQCGEQRSTKRSEARSSPTRRETPKKINALLSDYLSKMVYCNLVYLF